jgi:hypothetical protein
MNQTPQMAQEDKASIPFQFQYKNSIIHSNFLTLERREKRRGGENQKNKKKNREGVTGGAQLLCSCVRGKKNWQPPSFFLTPLTL